MLNHKVPKLAGLQAAAVLTLGLVAYQAPLSATLVGVDQIIYQSGSGQTVSSISGTVDITTSGSTITIVLKNTSLDNAFTDSTAPASMLLTGLGLQLPGVNITGGTVSVGGSTPVNFDVGQSTSDISNQYLFANQAIDGYSQAGVLTVDSIVSSVANGQGTRFAGPPPTTLDGPGYGALSANETQFGSSTPGVRDAVTIVLNLNGTAPSVSTLDAGNVVLAFGSPNAVPEPTTMIAGALLLLPFGFSTLRVLRKKS
jgi:hypothetical protein